MGSQVAIEADQMAFQLYKGREIPTRVSRGKRPSRNCINHAGKIASIGTPTFMHETAPFAIDNLGMEVMNGPSIFLQTCCALIQPHPSSLVLDSK